MWSKLPENSWWLVLCVSLTAVPFLSDLGRLLPSKRIVRPSPQPTPLVERERVRPIEPIRRFEPIYAPDGKATFPNGWQVYLFDKG